MDVKLVAAARLQIALEAAERWTARSSARALTEAKLRAGGTAMADTPLRVGRFLQRQQLPARHVTNVELSSMGIRERFAERMIGPTLDWDYFPPTELARLSGVPVARIVILPQRGAAAIGFGTGFLVAPGVLMTNHHVLTSQSESRGIGAHFLFERLASQTDSVGLFFELDPDAFFITDVLLDFTLVAVKSIGVSGESVAGLGMLPLVGATGKILIGQPVNIIQHPNAEVKRYATTANKLLDLPDANFMQYETDTLPGSSGSPAFNTRWEVVGLHHSGVPATRDGKIIAVSGQAWDDSMGDDQIKWIANEGVRVSALVEHLRRVTLSDERQAALLRQVLEIGGMDALPPLAQPVSASLGNLEGGLVSAGSIVFNISGNTTINLTTAAATPSFGIAAAPLTATTNLSAPEKRLEFDPSYADRQGYDPDFLPGFSLPLPSVAAERSTELLSVNGEPLVLNYYHYSLAMNQSRRLLMWSAVNVDYSPLRRPFKGGRKDFGSEDWRLDPRISNKFQIGDNELYKGTQFDRGHIVRRDDSAWGDTIRQQEFANADTFHYTNCTPQHKAFNQAAMEGLWGQLEDYIKTAMAAVGNRACIYAGPILAVSDPAGEFDGGMIQYPVRFWKVFVAAELDNNQDHLRAYGFILDQQAVIDRFGLDERLDFGALGVYQVPLGQITGSTGVIFDAAVTSADVMATPNAAPSAAVNLASLEAIKLR